MEEGGEVIEAIKIERLSKNFGALRVLSDISLTVESGERLAIIGPNGAGKTTLLNIITGEIPATAGRISILGRDISSIPIHQHVSIGLARSFQISRIFYNLTVFENVSLALLGTGPYRYQMLRSVTAYDGVLAQAEELLELTGLAEKRNELTTSMSYGEQRRLELILALASKPKVLLLDEPSAGLAIGEVPDFINTIKSLAKDTTLVFTAHDMDVVFSLAKRILVLYFGRFIADDTPEEVLRNPLVREVYLGTDESG